MKKKKICFIGADPFFEGGVGLYQKNIIKYLRKKDKNAEITVICFGKKGETKEIDGVKYVRIQNRFPYPMDQIVDNIKIHKYLKKNQFDIINSHALWGFWMGFSKKLQGQKWINTYHGVTYNYFKIHLQRFSLIKKIILSPLLPFAYFLEKPPIRKADEIICVSEKVKNQLKELYNSKREMKAIRTGVDTSEFRIRDKKNVRKMLNLNTSNTYGLYIGKGGYWIKGLDRAVEISEEMHKKDKNYRMIIVGAEYGKIKHLLGKEFITYIERVPREEIEYYYNAADFLFYLSRYDGGAPTLVVSEAMASGCPVIFSKDSEQEIIKDKNNGIILEEFGKNGAGRILKEIKDKARMKKLIKNASETIRGLSLDKWGERYVNVLNY